MAKFGERSVLLFSNDQSLLLTRTLLLEREGCTVLSASKIPDFRTCLLSRSFDLILLCQSISAEECESAADFAREHAPLARLLVMFTRVGKCIPDHADVLLDAQAGPRAFIETAQRMLANFTSRAN